MEQRIPNAICSKELREQVVTTALTYYLKIGVHYTLTHSI